MHAFQQHLTVWAAALGRLGKRGVRECSPAKGKQDRAALLSQPHVRCLAKVYWWVLWSKPAGSLRNLARTKGLLGTGH